MLHQLLLHPLPWQAHLPPYYYYTSGASTHCAFLSTWPGKGRRGAPTMLGRGNGRNEDTKIEKEVEDFVCLSSDGA